MSSDYGCASLRPAEIDHVGKAGCRTARRSPPQGLLRVLPHRPRLRLRPRETGDYVYLADVAASRVGSVLRGERFIALTTPFFKQVGF